MMYLVDGSRFVVNRTHLKFSWETKLEGTADWLSQEADSEMATKIPVGDYRLLFRINNTCGTEQRVKLGCNSASRNELAVMELSIQSCPGLE